VNSPLDIFEEKFPHQLKTLKEISRNGNDCLIDILDEHFCFDDIVDEYFAGTANDKVQKFDAIIFNKKTIYCIEFKDSTPRKIHNREVRGKASEGYASFSKICHDNNLSLQDYRLIFMVVYELPEQQSNRQRIQSRISDTIQFGLQKYKNKFYNDILTLDKVKFEELYYEFYKKERN